MVDTTKLSTEARERLLRNYYEKRIGLEEGEVEEDALALHHDKTAHRIEAIPNKLKLLFASAGEHCLLPGC